MLGRIFSNKEVSPADDIVSKLLNKETTATEKEKIVDYFLQSPELKQPVLDKLVSVFKPMYELLERAKEETEKHLIYISFKEQNNIPLTDEDGITALMLSVPGIICGKQLEMHKALMEMINSKLSAQHTAENDLRPRSPR